MTQVLLKDIRIQAAHGVYDGEEDWGTTFRVNLAIDLKKDPPFEKLDDTVDYAKVYEMIRSAFVIKEALIENLADHICRSVFDAFSVVNSVEISIIKEDPPIRGFEGEVGIVYRKTLDS